MKKSIQDQVKQYQETGKLPTHPHIHCSKCQEKTVMAYGNLSKRVQKFGGIEQLLTSFTCKACRPEREKVVRVKREFKRKKGKRVEMPSMKFSPRTPVVLNENPDFAAEVTNHSCWRPDIFLDSERTCDFCPIYNVCKAPCRNLSKHGYQLEVA